MRFLVTAGNTRERIDRVRDWGNIFTGNTGYSIAKSLADLGEVDLLTSNQNHLAEISASTRTRHEINGTHFTSHADLLNLLTTMVPRQKYDAIFMTAAVADYKPSGAFNVVERKQLDDGSEQWIVQNVSAGKVKSFYKEVAFLGEQTEKIVDLFRTHWKYSGLLVKFKLEVEIATEQLLQIAAKSRVASDADYIVANTLEMVQGDKPGAYLLSAAGQEWVPRDQLAMRLVQVVRDYQTAK